MPLLLMTLMCLWLLAAAPLAAQNRGVPVPGQPWYRYETIDSLGRSILFYLSEGDDASRKPLIVFVQGSGASSHFVCSNTGCRSATGHGSLFDATEGRARLLLVEKPGVTFGDDGSQQSTEFRRQHTLPRWTAAIDGAIRAAIAMPGIDAGAVTVIGHSEGGIAAARLAGTSTTAGRVVLIAGEGPSQLFSLIRLTRSGALLQASGSDADSRERALLAVWDSIRAEPDAVERTFFGHAYPRWATFMGSSPSDEIAGFGGPILIVQGSSDTAVDPVSAEALFATLRVRGQRVELWRIAGADHSLRRESGEDLWGPTLQGIVDWVLAPPTSDPSRR